MSYFEWLQNRAGDYWERDKVHHRLQRMMSEAFEAIWRIASDRDVDLRIAAYIHALKRLTEAIDSKGTREFFTSK